MLPAGAAAAAVHPVQQSVIALLEKVVSLRLLFMSLLELCRISSVLQHYANLLAKAMNSWCIQDNSYAAMAYLGRSCDAWHCRRY